MPSTWTPDVGTTNAETEEVTLRRISSPPPGAQSTTDDSDTRVGQHPAKFERAFRRQIVWTISATFTFNALLAAWITAFH